MKILYDYQIFSTQKYGGISRYYTQLIKNFPIEIEYEIGIKYSDNGYLNNSIVNDLERFSDPFCKFLPQFQFKGKRRLFNLVKKFKNYESDPLTTNKKRTIELLKRKDFDVFHPTYYDSYFLEYLDNKPFILTIHDMIHELFPEMMYESKLLKDKALLAKEASHIIAVSNNTKQDIVNILKVPPAKISVVYHANSLEKKEVQDIILPQRFLLYVGARKYYKNFLFFANALKQILIENEDLFVICAGEPLDDIETDFLSRLNILDRFRSVKASDEILVSLYEKALAFVNPSYYEGFGIPIIEAFFFKCPVILSDSSCFREIAKDASLYFNPKCTKSINNVINRVLSDSDLREKLIAKGSKRVSDFSWKESAYKTASVYKNLFAH